MNVLYIGGTGEISHACVMESLKLGHKVTLFNRGHRVDDVPEEVEIIRGDVTDMDSYSALTGREFDAVCQFFAFDTEQIERDLAVFGGRVGQYVFISTASAYYKPTHRYAPITEETPLTNPYWEYSQKKARMESRLLELGDRLPSTIVRPSHTYRANFPVALGGGDWIGERMLAGKPVIVHGDGTSLWTLTHSEDFARPFARLLGNAEAVGEDFHITRDEPYTWDQIYDAIAVALEVEPHFVHVASDTLVQYEPEWAGPILGDKTPSTVFDNSKVESVAGAFRGEVSLEEGMKRAADAFLERRQHGGADPELDAALYERVIAEQRSLK